MTPFTEFFAPEYSATRFYATSIYFISRKNQEILTLLLLKGKIATKTIKHSITIKNHPTAVNNRTCDPTLYINNKKRKKNGQQLLPVKCQWDFTIQ